MTIRIFYNSWNKAEHVVNPANFVLTSDLKFVLIVTCTAISLVIPRKRYFPDLNLKIAIPATYPIVILLLL